MQPRGAGSQVRADRLAGILNQLLKIRSLLPLSRVARYHLRVDRPVPNLEPMQREMSQQLKRLLSGLEADCNELAMAQRRGKLDGAQQGLENASAVRAAVQTLSQALQK